jgi:hypothetical protein
VVGQHANLRAWDMIVIKIGGSEGADFGAICADVADQTALREGLHRLSRARSMGWWSSRSSDTVKLQPKGLVCEPIEAYLRFLGEAEHQ